MVISSKFLFIVIFHNFQCENILRTNISSRNESQLPINCIDPLFLSHHFAFLHWQTSADSRIFRYLIQKTKDSFYSLSVLVKSNYFFICAEQQNFHTISLILWWITNFALVMGLKKSLVLFPVLPLCGRY